MQVKLLMLAVPLALFGAQPPTVSVLRVPPDAFPACSGAPIYGTLGIVEKDGKQRTKLTPDEVGDYIARRLKQGYRVTLYPQLSGKIFAISNCPTDGQE